MRAWATVIQLDLQVAAVVGDMIAGRPAIYTTFLAYDEVAHHSGIERPDTLKVLRKVDRQIRRIVDAADFARRPYRFVVLSDHGQSQGVDLPRPLRPVSSRTWSETLSAARRSRRWRAERTTPAPTFTPRPPKPTARTTSPHAP